MKLRHIRIALSGLLLAGALFVVLPGLGRLFERADTYEQRKHVSIPSAAITQSVDAFAHEQMRGDHPDERFDMMEQSHMAFQNFKVSCVARDANGNVITRRVYYRSVPEAFSPGDAKT